ncbi:unnamed protein product [Mycena citricolor]|uniref:Uncharacterized protein n=1 Tax=Mycena citricolor TaxID=2018698 RepID=A0AAD2HB63_9AGAR|nr:unnamed protein product [Mycena citricolor]
MELFSLVSTRSLLPPDSSTRMFSSPSTSRTDSRRTCTGLATTSLIRHWPTPMCVLGLSEGISPTPSPKCGKAPPICRPGGRWPRTTKVENITLEGCSPRSQRKPCSAST